MFRASSAHLQEVNDVNCTCMQPLVFLFSAGGRLVHLLRGDCRVGINKGRNITFRPRHEVCSVFTVPVCTKLTCGSTEPNFSKVGQ